MRIIQTTSFNLSKTKKLVVLVSLFIVTACAESKHEVHSNNLQQTNLEIDSTNSNQVLDHYLTDEERFTKDGKILDLNLNGSSKTLDHNPKQFLEEFIIINSENSTKIATSYITFLINFPNNWIKEDDLGYLFSIIDSKVLCKTITSPLNSNIPSIPVYLGGYAQLFLTSYKENKRITYGLYLSPPKNKITSDELKKWWTKNK